MKTKNITAIHNVQTFCEDGHITEGVRFECDQFSHDMPVSAVKKAGGVKSVKSAVAAFVAAADKDAFVSPIIDWLEDGLLIGEASVDSVSMFKAPTRNDHREMKRMTEMAA